KNMEKTFDNSIVEVTSSQGSFVDATEDQQDKGSFGEREVLSGTPERVKRDMEFLNESWANMAENVDEEDALLNYLETKTPEIPKPTENFQSRLTKGQKKSQKKVNQSSKDSYATRSKNDKTFAISAVYAATSYLNRRRLWNSLNALQTQHDLPWCFIGDFNAILGSHENRGRTPPARLPMEEFQNWTDTFKLIHLPTKGATFTWENGRRGLRHTERRLDRAICNPSWLDMCTNLQVSTLAKHKSDHFPLLLDFNLNLISFASHFKFMRMWTTHPDCDKIIKDCWGKTVVGCPMYILSQKLKLVKDKLKSWNKVCFGNVHESVTSA
ncbi:RNA-directed DNA polymerase (Reverse transcriptase), partial [Trifolium medium]|nr:RNA-directed DNA polymerase (Reverse transcriptase) [Trifolium medium]